MLLLFLFGVAGVIEFVIVGGVACVADVAAYFVWRR